MSTSFPASPHAMGFVRYYREPISQAFPIWWVWLSFPMLWKIEGETHGFPKWWSTPQNGNLMRKKHPYYRKNMSTNFPGPPHIMGFVAFSCAMGNWWRNLCISYMMKYTIGWESNEKQAPILWEKYEYQFPSLSPYHGSCCILL